MLPAGEVDIAQQPAEQPRGVDIGTAIADPLEGEARNRERCAGLFGLMHGTVEIAPEGLSGEQTGVGVDDTLGLERFQHALELTFECLQTYEGKDTFDQTNRIAFDPHQIGQPFVIHGGIVEQADR